MSTGLIFQNVVAYSLQIGMLVGLAAFVPALLRLRQPGAKLVYWQILLAACVLLPLQPWKQPVLSGTVDVTTTIVAVQTVHHQAPAWRMPRSEIALLLLAAGMAIRLGWLAVGFWKLRRYRRHSQPLEPAPAWSVEASLRLSDQVASPVTFGWRRPVVLLPSAFPAMDSRVREAILCHEVMHVRRGDWVFTVVEELVRAVFWFHPAIWWLLGEIGLAREQEVDRLAIEITHEREEYMDALLAIAGRRGQLDLAPAPLFLRKRHLRHRVVLILQEARMSKTRLISALAAGLAILAAACWLAMGAFPLTAAPQVVNDAPGVTVSMNGTAVMHRTGVTYPAAALQHGVQGTVSVEVRLDASGNVSDARVLSGPDELRKAALQSVLQWHFTHEAAGSTRVVGIAFEAPKPAGTEQVVSAGESVVVTGVAGGVTGGTRGVLGGIIGSIPTAPPPPSGSVGVAGGVAGPMKGVLGSIIGGVPTAPPPPPPPPALSLQQMSAGGPLHIKNIIVRGLSEQAKAELLSILPVHEGDELTADTQQRALQAAKEYDEHLSLMISTQRAASGELEVNLLISAPSSSAGPTTIKVGGNLQGLRILRKVEPVYPALARSAHVEGTVHLAIIIARDGTVQEIHSLGGPALLIQAAMDAVKQWVYTPTLLNGEPVGVETTVDVTYSMLQ